MSLNIKSREAMPPRAGRAGRGVLCAPDGGGGGRGWLRLAALARSASVCRCVSHVGSLSATRRALRVLWRLQLPRGVAWGSQDT